MDYTELLRRHTETGADITVATIPVTARDATGFGILKTDAEGTLITEFHEKPPLDQLDGKESPVDAEMQAAGRIYLASMGIYVFSEGVLPELLDGQPDAHDFGKQIIPSAISNMRVVSYPFDGYWSDIGTIRSFYEANLQLALPDPPFLLPACAEPASSRRAGPGRRPFGRRARSGACVRPGRSSAR